ncbi:MAG: hypothetical protein MJE66_20320 [Proteobacteria bacterium]|nr:hypothetical protein [Pseudomonadota bacterium]
MAPIGIAMFAAFAWVYEPPSTLGTLPFVVLLLIPSASLLTLAFLRRGLLTIRNPSLRSGGHYFVLVLEGLLFVPAVLVLVLAGAFVLLL